MGPIEVGMGVKALSVNAPVEIQEDGISPLAVAEEGFVHAVGQNLVIEAVEAKQVVLGALHGVRNHRPGLHDKGPIG